MVCKEDVLSWFKDLESYKRIDVLYNLLNMCLPFELRFIGSCVEEIGKYTYQGLRGPALIANDIEKLSKDETFNQGLLEENVRHRVLLYISLLSSRNYSVANFLYKKLLRTDQVDDIVKAISKDELLQSETLLLFTMALYHPAFTFEQKVYFGEILSRLIHISETKRIAPKPSVYGYPPGFGYPTYKKSAPEISSIPVKSAPTMCYSDTTMHQQPPGLPQLPPAPHLDFLWSPRPGFHCAGAPEVPPFPPPSISPQVSQQGSPSHSRSASPHRTQLSMRPPQHGHVIAQPPPGVPAAQPPPPVVTAQPVDCLGPPPNMPPPSQAPPMQMEQLSQSSLPMFQPEVKLADEELPSGLEEKQIREHPWPPAPPPQFMLDMKQNGLRFNVPKPRPFLAEQMQALSLDGENSLHYSNSSSNSSPNQTPPGTPSNTPSVTPHGPGRGNDGKVRNGIPLFGPPPMCDTTSPPPPPYSSVPFNYTPQFPPNRSLYPFSHNSYRPQYTGPYPTYQPTDNTYPNFTQSYSYVIYSSPSPFPPRNPPGCYNCGAPGHVGTDCTVQNIEEITQKKTYQLDYSSIMPDAEK